jgi:hypothetical protein
MQLCAKKKEKSYMLSNMDETPTEGNFCDERNNKLHPQIAEHCKKHMGYADRKKVKSKQLSDESTYFQVDDKSFFPLAGP